MTTLDIREIEAGIRDAYRRLDLAAKARYRNPANWEGRYGAAVDLADLRDALPAGWDKAQVDQALGLLSDHADVHMWPKNEQKHAAARDADAAVNIGASHLHAISIERKPPEADRVVERLRMRDRDHAQSQVAALDDATLAEVAAQMGVDTDTDPGVLRQRLVDKSVSNLDTWVADARQGQEDGSLLYRADTDPAWVAGWTDQDRQQVAAAAERLQKRATTDQYWAFVKDRADRWADATDQHADQHTDEHTDAPHEAQPDPNSHATDQMDPGEPAMNHGNHDDRQDNTDQHTTTHVYDTINADSIQFGSSGPSGPTGPASGGYATSGQNGPQGQFSVTIGNLNAADVAYGDNASAAGSAGTQGWSVSGASVQVTGDGDGWTAQVSHPDGQVEYQTSARADNGDDGWEA